MGAGCEMLAEAGFGESRAGDSAAVVRVVIRACQGAAGERVDWRVVVAAGDCQVAVGECWAGALAGDCLAVQVD